MLSKASSLSVDCVCMDLEDAVALTAKPQARGHIVAALNQWPANARTERLVRINPVGSGFELADLETVLAGPETKILPDGIVVPKVESAAQLQWVDEQITRLLGKEKGDGLILIALVESVQGMVRVGEIASAVPHRLRGLIFGADDYRASVGAVKSASSNEEVSFARNLVLLHAKANGLDAIDLVQTNFADPEVVAAEARQGVALGYTGKQIIHPKQIEPVQQAFAPDAASVEWARRVEAEAIIQASKGVGAFVVDGLMVDKPLIVKAQQIVAKARLCGMLNEEEKGKA
jgi:citrate lyase subunit beta-like protein